MSCQMVQLLADSHREDLLEAMHRLRLEGQLCDVTVQVDFQGELEEFEVHQVVLAASSGYFSGILLARDAPKKLFLSNIHTTDFATFLEYVYTGKVEIPHNKIGDVHEMSKLLDCKMLTEACCMILNAGSSTSKLLTEASSQDTEVDLDGVKLSRKTSVKKLRRQAWMKRPWSPKSGEVRPKRINIKVVADGEKDLKPKLQSRRLSNRLAGRKVLVGLPKKRKLKEMTTGPVENMDPDVLGSSLKEEALTEREEEGEEEEEEEARQEDAEDLPEADSQEEEPEDDTDDPLYQGMEDQEESEAGGRRRRSSKRGDTQYKCDKCQRTFLYEKSYLKHISISHGLQADVVYRCETCQQTFANRGNLKIHERHVHNDDRLFPCDVCAKTFKRKKDVIRHQRQVHEGGAGAMRHVCTVCSKSLSSRTALTLHERTHTGDKPFECPDCQAKFSQSSALKTHRRIHTGEKPFACDQCDARFNQKHMLCYHKRSHTGEKPFMCESCGKSFASKEYLRHHANIHTGSRPYKCELCGRGFAQRNSLHQHMKIHTGERPYSCGFCEKNFTQLNALQRHQRIHTGEKPYMCGLCNRTFTDKSTVRRHTMTHDMDAPWKNYLVVLKGNVEDKKPKVTPKVKVQKAKHGEQQQQQGGVQDGDGAKIQEGMVPAVPVSLSADWAGSGTIALVGHPGLGGITVIQTDVPPGTQIQPVVTTDSTGNSVLSLESTAGAAIPFSIPVSLAHTISSSSAGAMVAQVTEAVAVPTASVLEAAVSQTILAPVSAAILDPEDAVVEEGASISGEECITVHLSDLEEGQSCDGHQSTVGTGDTGTVEAMEVSIESTL